MRQLLLLICFTLFTTIFACAQHYSAPRYYDSLYYSTKIDSLEHLYGANKIIPEHLKLQVLLSLSHYPELKNTRIIFKEASIKTTLNARPTIASLLFKSREKRSYVIRINNSERARNTIHHVPFNASIGLLSHEFTHIADYIEKSFFGVLGRGLAYMKGNSKAKFEKEIDAFTVSKGLGWQLHDWSHYILYEAGAPDTYVEFKRNTYLTPEEILELLLD